MSRMLRILIGFLGLVAGAVLAPFALSNPAMVNKGLGVVLVIILAANIYIVLGGAIE